MNLAKFIGAFLVFFFLSGARADVGTHLGRTVVDAFDVTGLGILAAGALGTAIAFNQDQATHDAWVNHQRMSPEAASFGNFWGTGIPEAGIAGGQLVFDQEKGIVHTESLLVSTVVVFGLKYATKRPRPDS